MIGRIYPTAEDRWDFASYFDCADETYESQGFGAHRFTLTLDDLDATFVAEARRSADRWGLPWPPHLPDAEEFALAHPEIRLTPEQEEDDE